MYKVSNELISLLCHPQNRSRLLQEGNRLVSLAGGHTFPIRRGIPRLLINPPARHRAWGWLYNRIAFGYDLGVLWGWRLAFGGTPIDRQSYISEIEVQPGQRVLETAVGTGANLLLLPESAQYFGVDISYGMLQRCRKNLERRKRRAHLVQADMQALPFLDESFDVVLHMGGLQFTENPGRVIRELLRTARNGASITLVDECYSLPRLLRRANRNAGQPVSEGLDGLLQLVPVSDRHKTASRINDGELYLLKFTKPSGYME